MDSMLINPVPTDCTQFVPSLVAPTQTIMVQHLCTPRQCLSLQDLYVLQRTVLGPGQRWLYLLQGANGVREMVQLTMINPPSLQPHACLQAPVCMSPPEIAPPAMPEGMTQLSQEYDQIRSHNGDYARSSDGEFAYGR